MKKIRWISQGLFLFIFLFLFIQTESKGADELGYPVKLFLDFDPLVFISSLLSSHAVQTSFYLSIVVLVVTIIFGRVFCGWVCPLGTLNNMAGSLNHKRQRERNLHWHKAKYYILIFFIASSVFTLQLTGIMDPISLLIRSLSISIYPFFNYAVRSIFDVLYDLSPSGIATVSEPVYDGLKNSIISFKQPFFNQSLFIGLIFFTIIGLNLYERRFWCKYLCPLGALLGIVSKYSFLKRSVSEGCNECGACSKVCQGDAVPDKMNEWKISECMYCWNCDDVCTGNAVSFGFKKYSEKDEGIKGALDLGRRRVIVSILSGAAAVPLLRVTPISSASNLSPELIRPPGALEEKEFLRKCIKCGECMKVCITNGLQPTLLEAGFEGIWSPILVPGIGYCEYRCTLCGQVCPTGAIEKLPLETKVDIKIGLAMIDKSRCLPYAHSTPCIVCEEVCPTPKKAVWLEKVKVRNRKGEVIVLQQPRVDLSLCIGCGICEAKCPVVSRPAIYVTNIGESRSDKNQLLLQ